VDAATQAMADRAAIHDLQLTYARAVDRKDLDLVASCFAANAAYEGALGRGEIGTALVSLRTAMARYGRTFHHVGNVLVEVHGDRATSETYAIAYHRERADPRRQYVVAIRYVDELARHDDRWRITRRTVHREWERHQELD
jgi:3-phenylpropionate/cinnamic acid dioxygenase small subunit